LRAAEPPLGFHADAVLVSLIFEPRRDALLGGIWMYRGTIGFCGSVASEEQETQVVAGKR
jgi:hypothetical protein